MKLIFYFIFYHKKKRCQIVATFNVVSRPANELLADCVPIVENRNTTCSFSTFSDWGLCPGVKCGSIGVQKRYRTIVSL